MKKKVSKPNPLKVFNDNKAAAYKKAGGAMKDFKKSLPKAQKGTPFQSYMKTPGAVASDTVMKTLYPGSSWDAPKKPIAKNPKNQGTLEKAYEKTYGQNWRSESGQPASDETFEQYKRRMGPMKKGGSTKKSLPKAQTGKQTPFQQYMTTKGATAADTSATTPYKANKITANKPMLKQAYELTYGQDFGSSDVANPHSVFSSDRRGSHSGYRDMNNPARKSFETTVAKSKQKQKGGSVKSKKK